MARKVGNGEGSLYYSESEDKWIFQYYYNGKQHKMRQKKNERVKDFKIRVTDLKKTLNDDTYQDIYENEESWITNTNEEDDFEWEKIHFFTLFITN